MGSLNVPLHRAALFFTWTQAIQQQFHGDFFAESFDPKRPLETPRGLKDPKAAVSALIAAASQIKERGLPLDVMWGQVNHLHRGKYDFPGNGGSDFPWVLRGRGVFRNIAYAPAKDSHFDFIGGDSFVAAVEFSSPLKAKVLMTYGNTSDLGSPHFGDQIPLAARKEWREPWRKREEIERHVGLRTVFPGEAAVAPPASARQ